MLISFVDGKLFFTRLVENDEGIQVNRTGAKGASRNVEVALVEIALLR